MKPKREVLFVQGGGQDVHDQWDNKLVDSLRRELGSNYTVHYPRMPQEDDPGFERWKPALELAIGKLDNGAVLVAHSVGATILLRLLVEMTLAHALGVIVMIAAPFVGEGGWRDDEFEFSADLERRLPKGTPIHLFHGDEDDEVPPSHVALFARLLPGARVHRVPGRDHQFNNNLDVVAREILKLG